MCKGSWPVKTTSGTRRRYAAMNHWSCSILVSVVPKCKKRYIQSQNILQTRCNHYQDSGELFISLVLLRRRILRNRKCLYRKRFQEKKCRRSSRHGLRLAGCSTTLWVPLIRHIRMLGSRRRRLQIDYWHRIWIGVIAGWSFQAGGRLWM